MNFDLFGFLAADLSFHHWTCGEMVPHVMAETVMEFTGVQKDPGTRQIGLGSPIGRLSAGNAGP